MQSMQLVQPLVVDEDEEIAAAEEVADSILEEVIEETKISLLLPTLDGLHHVTLVLCLETAQHAP